MPPIRHEIVIQRNETQRIPMTSWTKIDALSTPTSKLQSSLTSSSPNSDIVVLSPVTPSQSALTDSETSLLLSNVSFSNANHTIILHALNSSIANLTENVAKLTQKVSEQNQNQNQITLVYHTNEGGEVSSLGGVVGGGGESVKLQSTTMKNEEELLILDQSLYEPANQVLSNGAAVGGVEEAQQTKFYNFLTGKYYIIFSYSRNFSNLHKYVCFFSHTLTFHFITNSLF